MKKSNLIKGIVSLIIILVLGGGVWFGVNMKKQKEKQKQTEETMKQEQVQEETSETVDMSNWKTYQDKEGIFEFKYPNDWSIDTDNSKLVVHSSSIRENMPEGGGSLVLETRKDTLGGFIKEYEALDSPHSKIIRQEAYVLNGISCTKLTAKTAIGIDQNFLFIPGKKNFILSFHDFDKYHLDIISTFKFINRDDIVDMSDWKIYKNKKFGFEFKYPEEFKLIISNDSIRLHKDCSEVNNNISARMKCDLENDISFGLTSKNLNQFVEEYKGDFSNGVPLTRISSQEKYVLDGVLGTKLEGTTAAASGGTDYIFVTNNNKNYIISYNQHSDVNLKIISTFKFLN